MRIVQLMTDRSRYFNPSKNYWFNFSAFLTDILKYMLLVDINNINVSGQRIFLLICYFCILMYNIPTPISTDLYFTSKRQHFRVFLSLKDNILPFEFQRSQSHFLHFGYFSAFEKDSYRSSPLLEFF